MESEKLPGWNAGHYRNHFERMQRAQKRWLTGWNWAAFLHSTGWFWYRRMYAWSVLNLITPLLFLALLAFALQWLVPERDLGVAVAALGTVYVLLVFVLLPLYADSLYLYRLQREGKVPRPPSAFTAAGALLLVVIPAWIVYISVQAQLEYSHRERVSEGLSIAHSLKTPVAEFHANRGRLPGSQEAAQFTYREKPKFARSVAWDPARRAIVATMGDREDGKRFELAAVEKGGALEWICRTIDLDAKYLPASCR
jgi:hypothetical protein